MHTELGSLYLQEGRFAVALEEAKAALAANDTFAPAHNLLALIRMNLGSNAEAEASFRKALSIAPDNPEIGNNLGWFLCQNGRERESFEYFLAAGRNPLYATPVKPYLNAAICSIRIRQFRDADNYLRRAQQLSPDNPQVYYWLADLAYRTDRLIEARANVVELERRVELTAEATWLALRIERRLGNREGEQRYGTQLRKRFPDSPEADRMLRGAFE